MRRRRRKKLLRIACTSYTSGVRFLTRWDQHAVAQEELSIQNRTRAGAIPKDKEEFIGYHP